KTPLPAVAAIGHHCRPRPPTWAGASFIQESQFLYQPSLESPAVATVPMRLSAPAACRGGGECRRTVSRSSIRDPGDDAVARRFPDGKQQNLSGRPRLCLSSVSAAPRRCKIDSLLRPRTALFR